MSLRSRSRFNSDSARSPSGAKILTTTARPTEAGIVSSSPTAGATAPIAMAATTKVAPIAPSHDFLGLMLGASGRLPHHVPTTGRRPRHVPGDRREDGECRDAQHRRLARVVLGAGLEPTRRETERGC